MVDLRAKPFYLNDKEIEWVENVIANMTLEEKLGQLFVTLKAVPGVSEERIRADLAVSHQGGLRWQGGDKETVWLQNTTYQKLSKIPLFIAANCDDGGSGCLPEGTFVATAAQCGAGQGTENAYHVGLAAGREASAIGCNWMFNPVADIYMNWRNTIVNTRAFSENTDTVIANVRAYIKGIKDANPNMACCCKHFPGDGVEELDQHLALGVNSLSVEEWNASFGKVYRTMIDEGLETIMVGHIALPEMSRRLRPGIADADIMPATLAPELITGLLRGEMGFNGLVITDASHMVGIAATAKRSDAVPGAIAAGCDMFLFANDIEEDIGYMRAGYEKGIITEERLPTRDQYIENYKQTIRNLAPFGVKVICYNFMPVFDWTRTDLFHPVGDGSTALYYQKDMIQNDYKAMAEYIMSFTEKYNMTFPGWEPERMAKLDELFKAYAPVTKEKLWENFKYFLEGILPTCHECNIKMAVHMDDPPWDIFGLPRLFTDAEAIDYFLNLVDDPYNCLTLCTGSLNANPDNDCASIIRKHCDRIAFAHIRNIKHFPNGDFSEAAHRDCCGETGILEVLKAYHDCGYEGYIRPDHGRHLWGEGPGTVRPGYGLYDRALGVMYMLGVWDMLDKLDDEKAKQN